MIATIVAHLLLSTAACLLVVSLGIAARDVARFTKGNRFGWALFAFKWVGLLGVIFVATSFLLGWAYETVCAFWGSP